MKLDRLGALIAIALLVVGAMSATIGTGIAVAAGTEDGYHKGDRIACRPARGETATIATAKLIIEYNSLHANFIFCFILVLKARPHAHISSRR